MKTMDIQDNVTNSRGGRGASLLRLALLPVLVMGGKGMAWL